MKKTTILLISFILFVISLVLLCILPNGRGEAVKYVIDKNVPKFKTIEGELFEVKEYEEGHYYMVDGEDNIYETNLQEWSRNRFYCFFVLIVKLVFLFSSLIFFGLVVFYYGLRRIVKKGNYLTS